MCLARPIHEFDTTNWEILDARDNIEILMDEVFDEKDKWNEGDYLKYLDLLKNFWEACNEWLLPDNCPMTINRLKDSWYESGNTAGKWKNSKWFGLASFLAADMTDGAHTLIARMSVTTYFIKCCSQYNTRKFIKKMKLPPSAVDGQLELDELLHLMVNAQKLTNIKSGGWSDKPEYMTDDGKKRYVWRQNQHLLYDMENIDYK